MSEQIVIGKATSSVTAARGVLVKLVLFSISLGVVPISSYFASQKYLWNGNSTYAALTAIVSANVILVAYIITSVWEDTTSTRDVSAKPSLETKKHQ
ncbi:putative VMA21-like domain containing protein [Lyophyllum shimeji]|uniref:VMA21-like domain containing protein n=1 Tax=Lyophyllum shimeji TaxID=47721 RepID=A0A9P3PDX8_LYOSH|nr:putative VMA21-like domain containing protein [Lyophyllum shimeji]